MNEDIEKYNTSQINILKNDKFGQVKCIDINGTAWFFLKDIAKITKQKNPSYLKKRYYVNSKIIKVDTKFGTTVNIIDLCSMLKILQAAHKITSLYKKEFIDFLIENHIEINAENIILFEYEEYAFLECLKDFLIPFGVSVISNYGIGKYRVDYYIKDWNLIIEYDERNHVSYDKNQERYREAFIQGNTDATIIRVSNQQSTSYNLGIIAQYITRIK